MFINQVSCKKKKTHNISLINHIFLPRFLQKRTENNHNFFSFSLEVLIYHKSQNYKNIQYTQSLIAYYFFVLMGVVR
jgi:hypothetical protein